MLFLIMNRVGNVQGLKFFVSGKVYSFACVSGRLKYDDHKFSVKCRVHGDNVIDIDCEQAESFEVSCQGAVVFLSLFPS